MPAASPARLVGLVLPPGEAFVAAAERIWERGDAVLPLDPAAPGEAVEQVLAALRPHAVVDEHGEHARDDGVDVAAGTAAVIATSGSTGLAKGVVLTWAALDASGRATLTRIESDADDRWLSCLPWHHIAGLQVFLRSRLSGASLQVHPAFDVGKVAATDADVVSLVPTQLLRLLDAGVDVARFRVVLLGGAAAAPALLDRARSAGARVVTTYGMSETSGGCVYDGRPLDGVEVRLDDEVVHIRGPVLMSGYRLRPDLTADALVDGWFRTQDVGSFDSTGRLHVHGRVDDIVVTGGENVVLTAVEHALAAHPLVRDAAVVAVPDDEWGQRVVAVVVTDSAASSSELRDWVKERLGRASAPRDVLVVDRIPLLASGKPDRAAIRASAQAGRDSG